jgi:hypothetical protein
VLITIILLKLIKPILYILKGEQFRQIFSKWFAKRVTLVFNISFTLLQNIKFYNCYTFSACIVILLVYNFMAVDKANKGEYNCLIPHTTSSPKMLVQVSIAFGYIVNLIATVRKAIQISQGHDRPNYILSLDIFIPFCSPYLIVIFLSVFFSLHFSIC